MFWITQLTLENQREWIKLGGLVQNFFSCFITKSQKSKAVA